MAQILLFWVQLAVADTHFLLGTLSPLWVFWDPNLTNLSARFLREGVRMAASTGSC